MNNIAPILQQLNGNQINPLQAMMPQIQTAKQAIRSISAMQNPTQALQQMLQSNPRYGEVMQTLNSFNGDINGAITALCQQKGIDPNEFMKALNSGF